MTSSSSSGLDRCWAKWKEVGYGRCYHGHTIKSDSQEYVSQASPPLISHQVLDSKTLNSSQFHFPSNGSGQVEPIDTPGPSDPRDIWGGYELKTPEGAEIDIHMRVYAQILLEGIRYPEIGRGSRTLLDGIPKLRTPVAFEKETMVYGWGFCFRQSLSVPKIMAGAVLVMVLGLMFVPFKFFASFSLITTIFILFILRLGAHTELRL
jgi:hypothetical protein